MKTALLDTTTFHMAAPAVVVGVPVSRGPVVVLAGPVPAPIRRR